jgi:hypothetical protein
MKNPFVWLTAFGLGAVGAHFLGFHFHIFQWIDGFGEAAGRGFRAALAAGGVVAFMLAVGRPHPERNEPRDAGSDPKQSPGAGTARRTAGTARVHDRWPKLARRSGYGRPSSEGAVTSRTSRPGY